MSTSSIMYFMNTYNTKQYIEQFHLLFLDQLSRKLDPKLYALKGGCNMRFYFKSIRYSEDIDLDIQIIHKETLRNKIKNILTSVPLKQILQFRGIEIITISEPKQTETTQRWKLTIKIEDFLLPLHTKIEFSRRGLQTGTKFEAIDPHLIQSYNLSPIMMNHYSADTAFQQKVHALASRSQTQARDLFDIYILLTSQIKNSSFAKKQKHIFHEAQIKAKTITFQDFKSQVLSYLAPEYQQQYDSKTVWNNIITQVNNALETK
jgi:predicted nucleotidyltransferase component of viral defense system